MGSAPFSDGVRLGWGGEWCGGGGVVGGGGGGWGVGGWVLGGGVWGGGGGGWGTSKLLVQTPSNPARITTALIKKKLHCRVLIAQKTSREEWKILPLKHRHIYKAQSQM